jgi:thioredoxin-like negative regulator of GroEL
MMAPAVDQLAGNFTGRAIVAKLNTDASPKTSMSFNIRGIPTSIVFFEGKEVARQSGALPYQSLAAMIEKGL